MKYRDSNICLDQRTNERGGRRTSRKHNVFADTVI